MNESVASAELTQRVRELEALARIAAGFTFEQPLESMMADLAEQVVLANPNSRACMVGAGDRETNLISRVLGTYGAPDGFKAIVERAWRTAGTPLVSGSLRSRATQVLVLADILARPGYEDVREAQRRAGWANMAVVPMVYREAALGLVFVFYPPGYLPGQTEIAFLEAIANQAAVAIENAWLFEQQRAAAITDERHRLSRDLHDSVSQALYAISLSAHAARRFIETQPAKSIAPLDQIVSLARLGLAEMRTMIFDLRPEVLASEGLIAGLSRLATSIGARHEISVITEFEAEPVLRDALKEALYRVAQEALQNAAKHAAAKQLSVRLSYEAGFAVLRVEDDGRGFEPGENFPGHLGLVSMRERAEQAGGTLVIESSPGRGSCVRFSVPVPS